jgi:hypothetical protein
MIARIIFEITIPECSGAQVKEWIDAEFDDDIILSEENPLFNLYLGDTLKPYNIGVELIDAWN